MHVSIASASRPVLSISRTASNRNGNSSRFTTKPGVSGTSTAVLPSVAHSARARSRVSSGGLGRERGDSISSIFGTGLKTCRPTKRSGWPLAPARTLTGSDEVVVARMASSARCASSARQISALASGSSTMASTTNVASSSTAGSRLTMTLPLTFAPRRSQMLWTLDFALSHEPSERANTVTWPCVAATAASPHAMAPGSRDCQTLRHEDVLPLG